MKTNKLDIVGLIDTDLVVKAENYESKKHANLGFAAIAASVCLIVCAACITLLAVGKNNGNITTNPIPENTYSESVPMPEGIIFSNGKVSVVVDGIDQNFKESENTLIDIYLYGYIDEEQEIEAVGYKIGENEPVFASYSSEKGNNTNRFKITISADDLSDGTVIYLAAKVHGQTVSFNSASIEIGENYAITVHGDNTAIPDRIPPASE